MLQIPSTSLVFSITVYWRMSSIISNQLEPIHLKQFLLYFRLIKRLESWIDVSVNQRFTPVEGNQSENTETRTSHESHDHQPQSQDHQPESADQSCDSGKNKTDNEVPLPDFPLLPASKGFCLTLKKYLENFKNVLNEHIWTKDIPDY